MTMTADPAFKYVKRLALRKSEKVPTFRSTAASAMLRVHTQRLDSVQSHRKKIKFTTLMHYSLLHSMNFTSNTQAFMRSDCVRSWLLMGLLI